MSEPMTAGDVLTALDASIKMARDNFRAVARDKGEDYAYGVLHGMTCLRVWLRSHEFEQYLEREKKHKAQAVLSTMETPK